jgi:hypothetical protein
LLDLELADIHATDCTGHDGAAPGLGAVSGSGAALAFDKFFEVCGRLGSAGLALPAFALGSSNALEAHVDALDDDVVAVLGCCDTLYEAHRSCYSADREGGRASGAQEREACVRSQVSPLC